MSVFKFKKFEIEQTGCAQKVGTDSMVLGAFVFHDNPNRILDIGAGNGVLALMMAQKFDKAHITGVEILKECADVAKSNFEKSDFSKRLSLINNDISNCDFSEKFDLIISNPPFFENGMPASNIDRATARHQSRLRLDQLIALAAGNLSLKGSIWLIVPQDSSASLVRNSMRFGLKLSRQVCVFGKPSHHKRNILVFRKSETSNECVKENFVIRTSNGEYTNEYKAKTLDFHHSRL